MENFLDYSNLSFYTFRTLTLEHFKTELIDYLDYYNNRRIVKAEGPDTCSTQIPDPSDRLIQIFV